MPRITFSVILLAMFGQVAFAHDAVSMGREDSIFMIFAARAVERLAIIGFGGLSIWLGYKLFDKVLAEQGDFTAGTDKFKIKMQRMSPGIFFALFGACILGYGLASPVSLGSDGEVAATYRAPDSAANRIRDALSSDPTLVSKLNGWLATKGKGDITVFDVLNSGGYEDLANEMIKEFKIP